MKTAILMQAHKNPEQVARLCRALRHPDFDIFLNLDAKSDSESFRRAIPGVEYIEKRINIYWGGFSQVRATLNGMEQILAAPQKYDFIMLVSGQDYPLIPMSDIAERLRQHPNRQFMTWRKIEKKDPTRKWFQRWNVELNNKQRSLRINYLIRKLRLIQRHPPFPAVYKGSQWWTLSAACAQYMVDYDRNMPEMVRFFKRIHCSDEFFFQTIILNSEFAGTAIPNNYRYIDWSGPELPRTFISSDYDRIVATDNWLARKFDADIDSRILDMLDEHIARLSAGKTLNGKT